MSAITVWIDESEIIHDGRSFWIIGQLIINSDHEELEFLKKLRVAHKRAKTWDTLHASEFSKSDERKWMLLLEWLGIFNEDNNVFFHSFIFERSTRWESSFATPHDYFAHQLLFGLANKMKSEGSNIQVLFKDVDVVTAIMDRRSANSGFILQQEDASSMPIARINELETMYEDRITRTINSHSHKKVALRFSFVNSRCFDAMQLCDCLTYLTRKKYLAELQREDIESSSDDFLALFANQFCDRYHQSLSDFSHYNKFNHFIGK